MNSMKESKVLYVGTNAEFQPFEYLENGKIVGFGDIIKVIDILSKRPQIQERLGAQIADVIYETLNCQGVMIVIKAKHMCMTMRGVKKPGSKTITSAVRGIFEKDIAARAEAMSLITMK